VSTLTTFRDHCRKMAAAKHKPECPTLHPWRPQWDWVRSNFGHDCGRCGHVWHGLDCRVAACTCMTAWTNPTTSTEA
jgi:hypothetical protein